LLFAAAVFWLASVPTSSPAQEPAASEPAPVEAAPSAIPLAEIALRADALESRLREVAAEVAAGEVEEGLEAELAAITTTIENARARLEQTADLERPRPELDALRLVWARARAGELDAFRAEIAEATELWRLTRDATRETSAPQLVVDRAVAAVRSLLAAADELTAQRDVALGLQARVAQRQRSLEPGLESIEAQRAELAASFFVRQHEPLWQGGLHLDAARAELSSMVTDLGRIGADLVSYSEVHRSRFALQLLIVLALGWMFSRAAGLRARPTQDEGQQEGSSEPSPDALRFPWTSALLFGLLVSFFLHPERGRGLQLVVPLAALPLWVRVSSALLPSALRGAVLVTAALALAELVRFAFSGFDLVMRGLLMLDLAAGFAGVIWLRRPERLHHITASLGRGLWFRILDGWLRLLGVAFGIGLLAAILGYSNLADRIAFLGVWVTVIGAAWLAVVRTFEAVAESVIESEPSAAASRLVCGAACGDSASSCGYTSS
jgi:hypothetical protein